MGRDVKCVLIDPPTMMVNISSKVRVKETAEKLTPFPPMGPAYIAAVLQANGIEVRIIDAKSLNLSLEKTVSRVVEEEPDFVGVTVFTSQLTSALDTCRKVKELCPLAKTVVGGPHIHPQQEEVIEKYGFIDFAIRGEGEVTMLELVDAISNGADLRKVKGITFREGEDIVVTPNRPFIDDLDTLPFPARDLLPNEVYQVATGSREQKFTAVTASRGCPFKCHFCSVPRFWPIRRHRSVDNVLDELEDVKGRGMEFVKFTDEVFGLSKKWTMAFCRGMVERGLSEALGWSCDCRVDTVSEDTLAEMKRANCQAIFYGLEFGNQRILDLAGKRTTLARMHRAVEMTRRVGISPIANFMIGYPGETRETIEETITLARTIGVEGTTFTIVTPFPGSQLCEYCEEHGLLRTKNWEEYNYSQPGKGIIKLREVTEQELMNLYEKAHWEFHFRHIRDEVVQELSEYSADAVEAVLGSADTTMS